MKKISSILCLFIIGLLFAQDSYQDWLEEEKTQKTDFVKSEKELYDKFMKKNWENFKVFNGVKEDKTPKPKNIPVVNEQNLDTKIDKDIEEKVKIKRKIKNLKEKIDSKKKDQKSEEKSYNDEKMFSIDFYGKKIEFSKLDFDFQNIEKVEKKIIAKYWSKFVENNQLNSFQKELTSIKKDLKLNDWAVYSLIFQVGNHYYEDRNKSKLLTWIMLDKLGYNCKIGFDDSNIAILLNVEQMVFDTSYLEIKDDKFFLLEPDGIIKKYKTIRTYKDKNIKTKKFSLEIKELPDFSDNIVTAKKFNYNNEEFKLEFSYNKAVIQFLKNYPKTSFDVYFNSPLYEYSFSVLLEELQPIIEGKSKGEALNLLLRFVQQSFDYRTDDLQFGYEKCFFAEEILFYPYSDCEDRAVFFAFLVDKVLNLEVIGLDYPGHVATAVKIEGYDGDKIEFNGNSYLICDPTYLNANIGVSMEKYKNTSPSVIVINN